MNKYEKLDALILASIGDQPKIFEILWDCDGIRAESEAIADAAGTVRSRWGVEPWHVFGRRLQALRKKGLIRATTKGWVKV